MAAVNKHKLHDMLTNIKWHQHKLDKHQTYSNQQLRAFPLSKCDSETSFLHQLFKGNSNLILSKPCKVAVQQLIYLFKRQSQLVGNILGGQRDWLQKQKRRKFKFEGRILNLIFDVYFFIISNREVGCFEGLSFVVPWQVEFGDP